MLKIEPETKVTQGDLRRQAGLEPSQDMGAFFRQPKVVIQFLEDGFDDLAQSSQPAAQGLGPGVVAGPSGPPNHLAAIVRPPVLMPGALLEASINHIEATDRLAAAFQARIRLGTRSEERLGQRLIFGAGWGAAKPRNQASGRDGHQQVEALIPAQPIAPANISLSDQPSPPTSLGVTGRNRSAIQRLIGVLWAEQRLRQVQGKGTDGLAVLTLQAVELGACGQARKSRPQMVLGIAVEGPFALKAGSLPKQRQGDDLASAQAGGWTRMRRFRHPLSLVKVINHHVQCRQEGIRVSRAFQFCFLPLKIGVILSSKGSTCNEPPYRTAAEQFPAPA